MNIEHVYPQIQRLEVLPFFRALTEVGLNELAKALSAATDLDQATRAVDWLVANCDTVPSVKAVNDALIAHRAIVAQCGACGDTGIGWIDPRVRTGAGLIASRWKPCEVCAEGRRMVAIHEKDEAYENQRP